MAIRREVRRTVEDLLAKGGWRDLAATWAKVQLEVGEDELSRSTFYLWAKEWREARGRDDSGTWTLATDKTGHPDVCMAVLGALASATDGLRLTHAEARWVTRLALAVPDIMRTDHEPTPVRLGPLSAYSWAQRYVDAEGDSERMAELDAEVAALYTPNVVDALRAARARQQQQRAATQAALDDAWEALAEGEKEQDDAR